MSVIGSLLAAHRAALQANRGESVVYQSGAATLSLTAVVGATSGDRFESNGLSVSFESVDFLITAAELILDGQTVQPKRGDLITWNGRAYVVASEITGDKPYTESIPGGDRLRVHTKLKRETV